MADPPTPSAIVVDIHLQVEAELNMFRVKATVQNRAGGINLYNETFTYAATYAEVIAWLSALVSSADASAPLALT